jgi:hypothetical protein
LDSAKSIDHAYIVTRLNALKTIARNKKTQPADVEEEATLVKRLELRTKQLDKVNELLTENEKALTEFGHANASLVEMKRLGSHTSGAELESAMKDLTDLAERAKKFAAIR